MKLPLSLLKSFIDIELSVSQISETLTLLGIEVDHVHNQKPTFAGIIAAEVTGCAPHPNGERLRVAQVNDGQKNYEVVCGAPNCRAGIRVAFAPPGSILTAEDGKPIRIETAKLRGIVSSGMLCSAEELHLAKESQGIIELPPDIDLGRDLTNVLWDPLFELSLTPNLGHCFSALGVARELSAALQLPLHIPCVSFTEHEKNPIHASNETNLCTRYMGRWIDKIQVGPSPFWLQQILIASGMNPINNVVDVTNYILLKWGQPMHAFDATLIEGKKLRVIANSHPQKFLGLDGVEREVPKGSILIADTQKPLAVAGVIGGENSAITPETKQIFLECAVFDPLSVRKTARQMGLRTESSQHFEKGVDPIGCAQALEEACHWIAQLTGGQIATGTIDLKHGSFQSKEIDCRVKRVNQLLGVSLSQTEIEGIFHRLSFKTHSEERAIRVEVPPFRSDIVEEVDLVEEVARIYGYNNITKGASLCTTSQQPQEPIYLFENEVRTSCVGQGLQEFLTADLIGPKLAELAQEFSQAETKTLKTIHSKSEEYSILRSSLLPGLVQVAKYNFDRKNETFSAFEIGRIYFQQDDQVIEAPMAAILLTGNSAPPNWSTKPRPVDFYDLKGIVENLLGSLHLPAPHFKQSRHLSFHPGRQADIFAGERQIGSLGEIHPSLLEKVGIEQRLLFGELQLKSMLLIQNKQIKMAPLPQFPASERDWTVSLPLTQQIETLFAAIHSAHIPILEKVELVDLYYPENGELKNATFRFTYRDRFKTISFEEVEAAHSKLLAEIVKPKI